MRGSGCCRSLRRHQRESVPTKDAASSAAESVRGTASSFHDVVRHTIKGVELSPISTRKPDEIERAVTAFAQGANGGLIIVTGTSAIVHRDIIIALAAQHRLPAVYPFRYYVTGGGLISYGPDPIDEYRRAASYVDRILHGEKPADLPVQAPTKYELVINLKTAKMLGITVPPLLLGRADEVIE
jgi:putative ABC transport system substrate-binding protein